MVAPSFLMCTARSAEDRVVWQIWESRQLAYPVIRRHVVVGIAVAVDIADVGGRPGHDRTQPPIDAARFLRCNTSRFYPVANELNAFSSTLDKPDLTVNHRD